MSDAARTLRQGRAMGRRARFIVLIAVALGPGGRESVRGAEVVPVNVRTAPGQFDISARDASTAHTVSAIADETWRRSAALLDLPPAFSSPIFVRIVGAAATGEAFGAMTEPGGIVSVWLDLAACERPAVVRKALMRGLLLRLGVAGRGAEAIRAVPRWLEEGCALWVDTRVSPAWLDAVKHETRFMPPPAIGGMLNDAPGRAEVGREAAALWLVTFLQAESTPQREWHALLQRVLGGSLADEALAMAFPGRFANVRDRELWWQTGWHQVRRSRAFPSMGTEESAHGIALLARFIFAPGGADTLVPLRTIVANATDGIVGGEFERRAAELRRIAPVLHPFYRNAGLSLLDVFVQARTKSPAQREALVATFETDWREAQELEAASTQALDALEQRLP